MKVYCVYKNYQMSDGDGWENWVEEQIIAYYSSIDKANKAVSVSIANAVKMHEEHLLRNPDCYTSEQIKTDIDLLKSNHVIIYEGHNGRNSVDYILYDIREIQVL